MQFYSYVSIKLPLLGFHNCMFALLCWEIFKRGERLDGTEPTVNICAANESNVIVLINRDTASVLCGRRLGISISVSFCLS